jgi:hypothetical protein
MPALHPGYECAFNFTENDMASAPPPPQQRSQAWSTSEPDLRSLRRRGRRPPCASPLLADVGISLEPHRD